MDNFPKHVAELISDGALLDKFEAFLKEAFADECIHFLNDVREYEELSSAKGVSVEKLLPKAKYIVDLYVEDMSEQQVNLSSKQFNSILGIMKKDRPTIEDLLNLFAEAKAEIIKLLNSNFFSQFARNIADERRKEEWLKMSESGWRFTGLEPFLALEDHFKYGGNQHERLVRFLNLRMSHLKQMKISMSKGRKYHQLVTQITEDDFVQMKLPKIAWLLMRLYNLPQIRMKALQKYIDQLTEIWKSLFNFRAMLEESYKSVWNECEDTVKKLLAFRDKIKDAHAQYIDLRKPYIGANGMAKVPKATYKKMLKLQEIKTSNFSSLCNAEEKSKHVMQAAVEKLQSLEFNRLEHLRSILNKVSFADYNFTKDMILALKPIISFVAENNLMDDAKEYALCNKFQGSYEFEPSDVLEGSIAFGQKEFVELITTLGNCTEALKLFFLSQPSLLEQMLDDYRSTVMKDLVSLSQQEDEEQANAYPVEARNVTLPSLEVALTTFYKQANTVPQDVLIRLHETVMNSVEILNRSPASEQASYIKAFENFLEAVRLYHQESRPLESEALAYRQMKREQVNLMAQMRYADEATEMSLITRYSKLEQDIEPSVRVLKKVINLRDNALKLKVTTTEKLMEGRVARFSNSLTRLFTYQQHEFEKLQARIMSASVEIDPIKDIELVGSLKIYKEQDKYDMEGAFRMLSDTTDFNTLGRKKTNVLTKMGSFKFL